MTSPSSPDQEDTVTTPAMPGPPTVPRRIAIAVAVVAGAFVLTQLPILFGLALVISAMTRRPLLAAAAALRRWPQQDGTAGPRDPARLTVAWGVVLIVIGLAQGVAAITMGLSITNPVSFAIRTSFALVVLAVTAGVTVFSLRRTASRLWQRECPAYGGDRHARDRRIDAPKAAGSGRVLWRADCDGSAGRVAGS